MDFKEAFVPVISAVAALLGVVNVWQNNTANQEIETLKAQLIQRDYQRKFASEIMQRFDSVVTSNTQDLSIRISRLEGLNALAGLLDRDKQVAGLDSTGILSVIESQAQAYKQEIEIASRSASPEQAEVLSTQFVRVAAVGESASKALEQIEAKVPETADKPAPVTPKRSALDTMRVDIFWCAGGENQSDNFRVATRLLQKRPSTSQREWRVKQLAAEINARPGYSVRAPQIRTDAPGESAAARQLNALAEDLGVTFSEKVAGATGSAGIISAFICQAEG